MKPFHAICVGLLLALLSFTSVLLDSPAMAQKSGGAPVQGVPQNSSTLNSSVTITSGNTFQSVLPSIIGLRTIRQSLTIQNNNTGTDNCWVYLGPTASASKALAIILGPGQAYTRYWPYIPADNIAVTCQTTSDTMYVDSQ